MANICDFEMKVVGTHENIDEFVRRMGNYMGVEQECERELRGDGVTEVSVLSGYCKWSVLSAFFQSEAHIVNLSYELSLDIEIYSSEPGCCFQEHYILKKGNIETEECVDYHEIYIHDYKFPEDLKQEYDIVVTQEEWDCALKEDEWLRTGGFPDWSFSI